MLAPQQALAEQPTWVQASTNLFFDVDVIFPAFLRVTCLGGRAHVIIDWRMRVAAGLTDAQPVEIGIDGATERAEWLALDRDLRRMEAPRGYAFLEQAAAAAEVTIATSNRQGQRVEARFDFRSFEPVLAAVRDQCPHD